MRFKIEVLDVPKVPRPQEDFDPALFHDPLARQIDWEPLGQADGDYRLVQTDDHRLEGKSVLWVKVFVWVFMLAGFYMIIPGILMLNLMAFLPGLICLGIGWWFKRLSSAPLVFDKQTMRFSRGRDPEEGVDACDLSQVRALQIVRYCYQDSDNDEVEKCELNLVCDDGHRVNVSDFNPENIQSNARLLAAFLQLPVWDNSGLMRRQEEKAQSLEEVHEEINAPIPFPWFMLIVPNVILLFGVLWAKWDVAQVVWLMFIEAAAIVMMELIRAALTQGVKGFWSVLLFFIALIPFYAPSVGMTYAALHIPDFFKERGAVVLPFPETSWFVWMLGLFLFARLVEMGLEYLQLHRLRQDETGKGMINTMVWLFLVAWLGVMLSGSLGLGSVGLGFVFAIVVLRVVMTLAGYVFARWRKTGLV
ncbi:MAG: DUF6498-containing protein [Neisseria sp.]|nr:DUF6498-containing protein [Neisseria sp.]